MRLRFHLCFVGLVLAGAELHAALPPAAQSPAVVSSAAGETEVLSLARLRDEAGAEPAVGSFEFGGVIRAVLPERGLLALQDASSAALLELPGLDPSLSAGQHVLIRANHCLLGRTRYGLQVAALPVVDNDGLHSASEKSGRIFLAAGLQPIRVEWFNGPSDRALNLDYTGPGFLRKRVPASVLWCQPGGMSGMTNLQAGVWYRAYEENDLRGLPNFSGLVFHWPSRFQAFRKIAESISLYGF